MIDKHIIAVAVIIAFSHTKKTQVNPRRIGICLLKKSIVLELHALEDSQFQMRRQLPFLGSAKQGIIVVTRAKTFAKEPKFAKLLRG